MKEKLLKLLDLIETDLGEGMGVLEEIIGMVSATEYKDACEKIEKALRDFDTDEAEKLIVDLKDKIS